MKATTIAPTKKAASIMLEAWQDLVTLTQETDRLGETVYVIRMRIGTMRPWVIGPYTAKSKACEDFSTFTRAIDYELDECVTNASYHLDAELHREF